MSQANENDCSCDLVPPANVDSQQGAVVKQRLGAAEVAPTLREQIDVIEENIAVLRDSFIDRIGPTKGQITEPGIAREIECLEATLAILQRLEGDTGGTRELTHD